jgi:hypothetical protein
LDKKLKVIPKPKENTRAVLVLKPDPNKTSTVIKGQGDVNLICGYCESVLCENVNFGQIRNLVVKCPVCNNYNDTQ